MADASIVITAGSGTNLHSDTRSYSGTTKHDQYVLPAEYTQPSYSVIANNISIATADSHILQIMAGSSLPVRIRSILIEQNANVTTASRCTFELWRLSTAGTGGSTVTPRPYDTADSAAGCTAMTLPSSKGTETVTLKSSILLLRQAFLTTAAQPEENISWVQLPNIKPIIIPAGTTNGIAIKNTSALAGGTMTLLVELVETSFV